MPFFLYDICLRRILPVVTRARFADSRSLFFGAFCWRGVPLRIACAAPPPSSLYLLSLSHVPAAGDPGGRHLCLHLPCPPTPPAGPTLPACLHPLPSPTPQHPHPLRFACSLVPTHCSCHFAVAFSEPPGLFYLLHTAHFLPLICTYLPRVLLPLPDSWSLLCPARCHAVLVHSSSGVAHAAFSC